MKRIKDQRHPKWACLLPALFLGLAACSAPITQDSTTTIPEATVPDPTTTTTEVSPSTEASPSFDNSRWITFQGRTEGERHRAFLIHPDGSGEMEIPRPEGTFVLLPAWSPDGNKIVLGSRGAVPESLYVYDLAANSIEALFDCAEPCVAHAEPSYSPDGSSIVFVAESGPFVDDVPSDCGIWVGDVTTLEITRLTQNPGCDREYYPRFSPDGTQIVYFRWRDEGPERNAVFVIDSSGGDERQLTEWDQVAGHPDWSPDGQWIVFTTHPDWNDVATSNLYRIRPDGTDVEQLTFYEDTTFRHQPTSIHPRREMDPVHRPQGQR